MQVCAYNRTTEKVDHFLKNEAKGEPSLSQESTFQCLSNWWVWSKALMYQIPKKTTHL